MNEAVGTSLAAGDSLYDVDAKLLQVSIQVKTLYLLPKHPGMWPVLAAENGGGDGRDEGGPKNATEFCRQVCTLVLMFLHCSY